MVNSVDPDEMAHNEPSHLGLNCLQKYLYWSTGLKGLRTDTRSGRQLLSKEFASLTKAYFFSFQNRPHFSWCLPSSFSTEHYEAVPVLQFFVRVPVASYVTFVLSFFVPHFFLLLVPRESCAS